MINPSKSKTNSCCLECAPMLLDMHKRNMHLHQKFQCAKLELLQMNIDLSQYEQDSSQMIKKRRSHHSQYSHSSNRSMKHQLSTWNYNISSSNNSSALNSKTFVTEKKHGFIRGSHHHNHNHHHQSYQQHHLNSFDYFSTQPFSQQQDTVFMRFSKSPNSPKPSDDEKNNQQRDYKELTKHHNKNSKQYQQEEEYLGYLGSQQQENEIQRNKRTTQQQQHPRQSRDSFSLGVYKEMSFEGEESQRRQKKEIVKVKNEKYTQKEDNIVKQSPNKDEGARTYEKNINNKAQPCHYSIQPQKSERSDGNYQRISEYLRTQDSQVLIEARSTEEKSKRPQNNHQQQFAASSTLKQEAMQASNTNYNLTTSNNMHTAPTSNQINLANQRTSLDGGVCMVNQLQTQRSPNTPCQQRLGSNELGMTITNRSTTTLANFPIQNTPILQDLISSGKNSKRRGMKSPFDDNRKSYEKENCNPNTASSNKPEVSSFLHNWLAGKQQQQMQQQQQQSIHQMFEESEQQKNIADCKQVLFSDQFNDKGEDQLCEGEEDIDMSDQTGFFQKQSQMQGQMSQWDSRKQDDQEDPEGDEYNHANGLNNPKVQNKQKKLENYQFHHIQSNNNTYGSIQSGSINGSITSQYSQVPSSSSSSASCSTWYKIISVVGSRYFSTFDGKSEFQIGVTMKKPFSVEGGKVHGGYALHSTIEDALATQFPSNSKLIACPKALMAFRTKGPRFRVKQGCYVFQTIEPVEVMVLTE